MIARGQGPEAAEQERVVGWLVVVIREFVRGLHHHHRAGVFAVVLANSLAVGAQGFGLLNDVQTLALIEHRIHLVEGLKPCPKTGRGFADSFGHGANFSSAAPEQGHDLVGFTEQMRAQHDGIVSVGGHSPSIPPRQLFLPPGRTRRTD